MNNKVPKRSEGEASAKPPVSTAKRSGRKQSLTYARQSTTQCPVYEVSCKERKGLRFVIEQSEAISKFGSGSLTQNTLDLIWEIDSFDKEY